MASSFTSGRFQGFDASGNPLSGGQLFSYAAGTLTPLATYTTQSGGVANANPVVLDSAGRAPVWLSASSYRMVLKSSAGTTITDDDNISPYPGDSVVYLPGGSGSVETTVQAKLRERRSLRDFGATGDGATNDRDAIRLAIAWAKLTGGMLEASTEDTYFVGGFANITGETKFTIDFDGFYFDPHGCTFTCTANTDASLAGSYLQILFLIQDANNWHIGDMSVVADDVVRPGGSATGVCAVFIYNVAASTTLGSLGAIRGYKLMSALASSTTNAALYRHSGLVVKRASNDSGYYTVNFAENVDGLLANIYSNDSVRSFFVYGVTGHDVTIHTKLHSFFNDILIKRYTRDTSNIRVFYTCDSDVVSTPTISIEHQNDTDNGTISDIDITLNVLKSNPANPTIGFQSFTLAGVLRTTTASITRDVRLRGSTNSTTPILIASELSGEQQSRLDAYKGLMRNLLDYKRYIIPDGLTGIAAVGSAATSMSMKINVSEYKNLPTWGMLTVWGADNAVSGGANYFSRTAWVFFTVNSNGSLSGVANTTISTFTADPGAFSPALTVTAGAIGTFDLVVAITGYTGANRYCRATLQILGAQI